MHCLRLYNTQTACARTHTHTEGVWSVAQCYSNAGLWGDRPLPPQVEYQCEGFLEKNRDTVYDMLVEILRASKVGRDPRGVADSRRGWIGERGTAGSQPLAAGFYFIFFHG